MSEEYDVDAELAEALKALKEARLHLSRASYGLEQRAIKDSARSERAIVLTTVRGQHSGALDALATFVSNIASETRRLRKDNRLWRGGAA